MSKSNFLPLPSKRTVPLPDLPSKIRGYISEHFKDTHPDAFERDIAELGKLRRAWVEGKGEVHTEVVGGLMKYYAQLSFLSTKFPPDIGLSISYYLPFPSNFGFSPLNSTELITLPSLHFERASVLFNLASLYSSLAASEPRSDSAGIKRALAYLQSGAGCLSYLSTFLLPLLTPPNALSASGAGLGAAGYDLTPTFVGTMEKFLLGQAQECFWQKAVLEGTYKNGIVGRLSMAVGEFYEGALEKAGEGSAPAVNFLPRAWVAHMTVKKLHFEAAAHFRISQEDLEKGRYGHEVSRLQIADGLVKKAQVEAKHDVSPSVVSDLNGLAGVIATNLKRAIRDNDLVYVSPVPPASQLPLIAPAVMVKSTTPHEVQNSLEWILKDGTALFSGLVPYGVHLALSVYDDRKDSLIRGELEGKREELDAISATTLQSLGLPGAITALERPAGLPPALLKKAEEVYVGGGVQRIRRLMDEVSRLNQGDAVLLEETLDILDQEATEDESLLEQHPELIATRQRSHEANKHLVEQITRYQDTLKQAAKSDMDVLKKWQEWERVIEVLGGGEAALEDYIPSSGLSAMSSAQLPPSVRVLRGSLEALDDLRSHRTRLVAEARRVAERDDIRPQVISEASKLAHGGSGDVKTEWFEDIFEKEMKKYDRLVREMEGLNGKQDELLKAIKAQNDAFLRERKEDSRVKHREKKLQEMELAYWKWREVMGNCEEGIKFYNGFAALLARYKESVQEWVYTRRMDVGRLTSQMQDLRTSPSAPQTARQASKAPERSQPASVPSLPAIPSFPSAPTFTLPPPGSGTWQSAMEILPPPPAPVRQSSQMDSPARAQLSAPPPPAESTPRRSTRHAPQGVSGDMGKGKKREEVIPNPYQSGGKRKGHGIV